MTWNNRIMKHVTEHGIFYGMHEVYYDEDGKVDGWTKNPITRLYDDVEELEGHFKQLINDLKRSRNNILDYDADSKWDHDLVAQSKK